MTPTILQRNRPARSRSSAFLVLAALGVLLAAGCLGSAGGDGAPSGYDPQNEPTFLTPVAEAQGAGVEVYWMGAEFQAASRLFRLRPVADAYPNGGAFPGVALLHGADTGGGNVTFDLKTFSKQGDGAARVREQVTAVTGTMSTSVQVGSWQGELFTVPGPGRPVNKVFLFLDIGDMTVIGRADSGRTGVPGDDPNPLIDAELLIEVVAENLRPYPQ